MKLRFLENHDRPRARFCIPDSISRENWTAFLFFQKGMTLLYNGQESESIHRPSLLDKDDIQWNAGSNISEKLKKLAAIKHHVLPDNGSYTVQDGGNHIILAEYKEGDRRLIGIFSTKGTPGMVRADVPDGVYMNLLNDSNIYAESGFVCNEGAPQIFEIRK